MKLGLSLLRCSSVNKVAMELTDVVRTLNKFAPLRFAGSWDNVGLLVEPPSLSNVSRMLLTNDLTEPVLEEAVAGKADFILSYHPPIFQALKKVTQRHWKERIVGTCLQRGIAVYSPHTAYDALHGGVNDWLVGVFGDAVVEPLERSTSSSPFSHQLQVISVDECSTKNLQDELSALKHSPYAILSDAHQLPVTILSSQKDLPSLISILINFNAKFVLSHCENVPELHTGMGRRATLSAPETIGSIIQRLKTLTGLSHVRLALAMNHSLDTIVSSGAVCAGSGISVLRNVQADLIVSGEMGHHDVLEFTQTGRSVVLLEHSNSERGFLSAVLQPKLQSLFKNRISVVVSQKDRDPLQIV
ncbi:NIF3-like protein 1 [Hyalella azteca]|uniref:NIF3-like protein 1 n=1 Tax=Hyalella azteca TaxID=294128 RepID=A0A8B7N4Z2_HYAAZ|nr:NIF3-like protein 1 [Hyalella azteca]